ncbi:helix-turn-helix domain-containing protein [Methylobacterium sp. BTF04]|uniref:helix-turn-helix domain-containing protein n=1 Tax=Methylobacterium sp. BTF04 TaxID=2708300 RepID=UPI0013D1C4C6|nr:helix-turn-helix domain-containing protein [Methylobacterium sp. BTF04]NEU12735.1 helix-turn-helix domain-containing protein [Methylobacterium sp. BTF04]
MSAIPCDRFVPPSDPALHGRSWCEHLAPVFEAQIARDADLSAAITLTSYNFGEVILGTVAAPAQRLERSARMIARQGIDHIFIQFYRSGRSEVTVGRRAGQVQPSQIVVFDLAQPLVSEAGPVSATTIMLPRKLLSDRVGDIGDLHGQALDYGSDAMRTLCHTYLAGLADSAAQIEPHQARHLSGAAAALVAACFQPDAPRTRAADQLLGIAIRHYIEEELASESLDVDAVIARFKISRATLYRLFEAVGGVAGYIRERRLLRAMRLLSAEGARPRVSAVAYATGFSDEKTFSRAFNRRFGLLPRDAASGHATVPAVTGTGSTLLAWMRSLAA